MVFCQRNSNGGIERFKRRERLAFLMEKSQSVELTWSEHLHKAVVVGNLTHFDVCTQKAKLERRASSAMVVIASSN